MNDEDTEKESGESLRHIEHEEETKRRRVEPLGDCEKGFDKGVAMV